MTRGQIAALIGGGVFVLIGLLVTWICVSVQKWESQKPSDDRGLLVTDKFEDRDVWVWAKPVLANELRVEFRLKEFKNMKADRAAPYTIEIKPQGGSSTLPKEVVLFHSHCDNKDKWSCHYRYTWKVGVRGGKPDPDAVYELPFLKGQRFPVTQTSFAETHTRVDGTTYAVDFGMPVGTTVCAARDGIVIALREDSDCGGEQLPEYKNSANYLIVKHSDGTYGEYDHIKKDGVLVQLGDNVRAGQKIALSGNTGYSSGPHLHFNVYYVDDKYQKQSVPIAFATDGGTKYRLELTTYGH